MRYLLLTAFLLAGCEIKVAESPAKSHKCNLEQLDGVKKYMDLCNNNGYLRDYCFDRSVESFCTPNKESK